MLVSDLRDLGQEAKHDPDDPALKDFKAAANIYVSIYDLETSQPVPNIVIKAGYFHPTTGAKILAPHEAKTDVSGTLKIEFSQKLKTFIAPTAPDGKAILPAEFVFTPTAHFSGISFLLGTPKQIKAVTENSSTRPLLILAAGVAAGYLLSRLTK